MASSSSKSAASSATSPKSADGILASLQELFADRLGKQQQVILGEL